MYDDFHRAMDDFSKLPEKDRQHATTWLVVWGVLMVLRYAATGAVVFGLGWRIIGAFAMALRESHGKERNE